MGLALTICMPPFFCLKECCCYGWLVWFCVQLDMKCHCFGLGFSLRKKKSYFFVAKFGFSQVFYFLSKFPKFWRKTRYRNIIIFCVKHNTLQQKCSIWHIMETLEFLELSPFVTFCKLLTCGSNLHIK